MTTSFQTSDIVKFAAAKDAANLSTAFDDLISQRVADAISARKQEVARNMFAEPQAEQDQEQQEVEVEASAEDEAAAEDSDQHSTEESEDSDDSKETN